MFASGDGVPQFMGYEAVKSIVLVELAPPTLEIVGIHIAAGVRTASWSHIPVVIALRSLMVGAW